MNRNSYNNNNRTGFFSRNTPKQNLTKFKNQTKTEKTALNEINDWCGRNNDKDIKIKLSEGNKFILSMTHNGEHLVEITYPKSYPENKRGFSCKEIPQDGVLPIKFVKQANDQFDNKVLSIERVIEHLVTAFKKYKQLKKNNLESDSISSAQVIFKTNNFDTDIDSWSSNIKVISDPKINENSTDSDNYRINNNISEIIPESKIEMVNLDPDEMADLGTNNFDINTLPKDIVEVPLSNSSEEDHGIEEIRGSEVSNFPNLEPETIISEEVIQLINYKLELEKEQQIKDDTNKKMLNTNIDAELINKIIFEAKKYSNISDDVNNDMNIIDSIYNKKSVNQIQKPDHNDLVGKDTCTSVQKQLENTTIMVKPLDFDDRPEREEIFDLGSDVLFIRNKSTKKIGKSKKNNSRSPLQITHPISNKILTDQDFDDFVTKNFSMIETKYPTMEEDEIMDIIQKRWEKELATSKKRLQMTVISKEDINYQVDNINNSDDPIISVIKNEIDNASGDIIDNVTLDDKIIEDEPIKVDSEPEPDNKMEIITLSDNSESEGSDDIDNESYKDAKSIDSIDDDFIVDNESYKDAKSIDSIDDDFSDDDLNKCTKSIEAPFVNVTKSSNLKEKSNSKVEKKLTIPVIPASICKPSTIDNNKISFDDVEDHMGIYMNLSKYSESSKLPFDIERLYNNAKKIQDKMDLAGPNQINKLFSSTSSIRVAINEFKKTYYAGLRNNYTITPVNENIYHLMLKFSKEFFDPKTKIFSDIEKYNTEVQIEIHIDGKLYPFYPPKVRLITPRLLNHMNARIATMECLLPGRWDPSYNFEIIITHFKKLMNEYGEIDTSNESYDKLENDLIDLTLISEIPARFNSYLTIDQLKNINMKVVNDDLKDINVKKHWVKGTGYGHSGLKEWDVKSTLKIKELNNKRLSRCIKNITIHLTKIIMNNINMDTVSIVSNSCFVPYIKSVFNGNSILGLLENTEQFEILLNSLRILTYEYTPLFTIKDNNDKSLYEIFGELIDDCKMYLKTMNVETELNEQNKAYIEIDLVRNFIFFFEKLQKWVEIYESDDHKQQQHIDLVEKSISLHELYKIHLAEESCMDFNEMDFNDFNKLIKSAGESVDTGFESISSMSTISKEILSHTKNLPLAYESSIFYRFNSENLKFHEFIIAGPEGTPYDSGCFHFRMYCPSNYPNRNPKVNIYTTGNGTVRFNPNLYDGGKVCLSILGTWNGQAGESWIPGTSTMMQIMISIQSLVMIPEPYFNEPGYESQYNSVNGQKFSKEYNHKVRLNCMKWAMIDIIKNPTKGFESAIEKHFTIKAKHIKDTCAIWVSEAPKLIKKEYKNTYSILCNELDKLIDKKRVIVPFNDKEKVHKQQILVDV